MRALLLILDGLGIGPQQVEATGTPSLHATPFVPDTLGHLLLATPELTLPALACVGLGALTGHTLAPKEMPVLGQYARMRSRSPGNDSASGHWELAGAILDKPFATFSRFPKELIAAIEQEAGVEFLGNCPGSTAEILHTYGKEHLSTRQPILYTTASSALQIAAHDSILPPQGLYQICRIARNHCDRWNIGRVIARPFTGVAGAWQEAPGRHDYVIAPPRTILNALSDNGYPVVGIGKISDIFARSGITRSRPATSNVEVLQIIDAVWEEHHDGLTVANLPDFDTLFGHRRDPLGYSHALKIFDNWLAGFFRRIEPDDLILITSDHGNDPLAPGTDHTVEDVPLLLIHNNTSGSLGTRDTLADVAATLASYFPMEKTGESTWPCGTPLVDFSHRTGPSLL